MLMFYRSLVALAVLAAAPAQAQLHSAPTAPSYNWVGGGYLWIRSGDDALSHQTGYAVVGSYTPMQRLVVSLGVETAGAQLDPSLADLSIDGTALVATVGTWWPLTDRIHLVAAIGADRERFSLSTPEVSVAENLWFANAVVGVNAAVGSRWEFGASIQRLEAINDAAQGESGWVSRLDASFRVSGRFDLVGSLAFENDEPGLLFGGRVRF